MDRDTKQILTIGAGAALLYLGVLNPLLKFLGLKKDEDTKQNDASASDPGSPWSPQFYKNTPGAILLTRASADVLTKTIYDSFGAFNDCEECAIGTFKMLNYQTQLSFLADIFYQNYGEDLITFLRGGSWPQDRLSDSDVAGITDYILKLPIK